MIMNRFDFKTTPCVSFFRIKLYHVCVYTTTFLLVYNFFIFSRKNYFMSLAQLSFYHTFGPWEDLTAFRKVNRQPEI